MKRLKKYWVALITGLTVGVSVLIVDFSQLPTGDNYWVSGWDISGSDTLLVDSLTGVGNPAWVITHCADQLANIDSGYISAKSSCKLNDQHIATLFPNANYADTTFYEMSPKVLHTDNKELLPYRLTSIVQYDAGLSGQDSIDVNTAFGVPPKPLGGFVVPDNYATIALALSAAGISDTIIVKDGVYKETDFLYWLDNSIRAIGNCIIQSTGTTYVILTTQEDSGFLSGFTIDGEGTTARGIQYTGAVNNKDLRNCVIKDITTRSMQITTTSTQKIDINISNNVYIAEEEILLNEFINFQENFFVNTDFNYSVPADGFRFEYNRVKYNDYAGTIFDYQNDLDTVYFNYNLIDNVTCNTLIDARNTTASLFEFKGNYINNDSLAFSNIRPDGFDKAYITDNYFYNNSNTAASNVILALFDNLYIRDNIFYTEYGQMTPILASSSSISTEVYIERNIDSSMSDQNYFIRIGTEATSGSDNNIDKIVIRDNKSYGLRYYTPSASTTRHGLLIGFLSGDQTITGNSIIGNGLNYVFKGSTGTNSTNVKIWSNLSSSASQYGYYPKGVDSVSFYNCTSYDDDRCFYFTANVGGDGAINCKVVNCIAQSSTGGYGYFFDVSSSSNFTSSNNVVWSDNISFYNGVNYNWSTWQGLGQDVNSFNTDPNLTIDLCPEVPTDAKGNGINVGIDSVIECGSSFPNTTKVAVTSPFDIGATSIYVQLDTIDNYVADTTMGIWSIKLNAAIFGYSGSTDTIELGLDPFKEWWRKTNIFISDVPETTNDTITSGVDTFEEIRVKFNDAVNYAND